MYYVFVTVGLQQWSVSLVDCVQVLKFNAARLLYSFAFCIIFYISYFIHYVIMKVSSADIK